MHNKKIVIFDLDGTILDTIGDITAAINRALSKYGFPPRTVSETQSFLGNGSLMLMRRATSGKASDELCYEIRELFRQEYSQNMCDSTTVYGGICELIDELSDRGIASAVVTNKDEKSAIPMIKHYFGDRIACVRGVRADNDRKPNPENTLSVIASLGFTPDQALFIGDGIADFEVSKNAEIDFIPVGYGYTPSEKLQSLCGKTPCPTVSSLRDEILKYLE